MGSYKIKRLDLPKSFVEVLEKQNMHNCKDVLCVTTTELQSLLGISYEEAIKLQVTISKKCASEASSVYDFYLKGKKIYENTFFPSSLHSLDMLLQGGLLLGSVTELAGPPGVGKTQFCFMLTILATLSTKMGGLDGQVIYIDTESAFSAERLKEIAEHRYPKLYPSKNDIQNLLQRVFVHKASSIGALKEIVPNIEKEIITKKVKLVIIDSIASLFRKEYGASLLQSVVERNNILLEQTAVLKDLARTYNIVVFLTNQITSSSNDYDPALSEYFPTDENRECDSAISINTSECAKLSVKRKKTQDTPNVDCVTPALGITWSHCVNTRLIAQFVDSNIRQLIIAKSPVAPNAALKYILDKTGVVLTDDDIEYVSISHTDKHKLQTKYNFLTDEVTGTGNIFSVNNS